MACLLWRGARGTQTQKTSHLNPVLNRLPALIYFNSFLNVSYFFDALPVVQWKQWAPDPGGPWQLLCFRWLKFCFCQNFCMKMPLKWCVLPTLPDRLAPCAVGVATPTHPPKLAHLSASLPPSLPPTFSLLKVNAHPFPLPQSYPPSLSEWE